MRQCCVYLCYNYCVFCAYAFISTIIFSFLDKLYVMSSNEALAHFMRNPRPYLAPHLPQPPCKLCVLGPPHSGKTAVTHALALRYNAKVNNIVQTSHLIHLMLKMLFQGKLLKCQI